MEAIKTMLTRHTIRKFTSEPISKEDLDTILNCALHSPTGRNAQQRQFTVLTKQKDIKQLEEVMTKNLERDKYSLFDPQVVIIVTVPRENDLGESDCAVALDHIYLSAHALGLGSCWINQLRQCQDKPEVRDLLTTYNIPQDHVSYGMMVLGHPDQEPMEKARKEIIHYV